MMNNSALLFFIDGLGIGAKNEANPLALAENVEPLAHFQNEKSEIFAGGVLVSTDPRLGVEGRPQSASGQTTILTGVNAPRLLGFHKQGFPNQTLREVIAEHSIFKKLKNLGVEPNIFANAYTPQFFTETPRWKSATTCAVEAAGMRFQRLSDLAGGYAVFHDFTNRQLIERGFDIDALTPREAGSNLARIVSRHRFTLYEHFITDKIGHAQDFTHAREHLPLLAEMIRAVLENVNLEKTTVILTSDHGNIEDLSVRTHTLNDVPTILWGRKSNQAAEKIRDLTDIAPCIVELLNS